MPARLTLPQQRALYRALPASRKNACKRVCQQCQMKGEGFMSILKKVGKALGPVAKEIGPTVLKEIVIPLVKKQVGSGLVPSGGALRLAGQRGRGPGRPKRRKPARRIARRIIKRKIGKGLGSL